MRSARGARARLGRVALAGAALLGACTEPLLESPAAMPPLVVSLSLSAGAAGGTAAAFARTDAAHLRMASGARVVLDTVVARSSAGDPGFGLTLRIPHASGSYQITADLNSQGQTLFRGTGTGALRRGFRDSVVVTVAPVIAAVVAPDSARTLTALGDTVQATAAAVFASGDTVTGPQPTWADDGVGVVRVSAAGLITAVREGQARLTATYQGLTATTRVRVRATVARIVLPEDSFTVSIDSTTALTAIARDRNGNALTRAFTWQTSNATTATVDSTGLVRALAPGRAVITALADGASASVVVVVPRVGIARVTVTPGFATLVPGDTLRLQATPLDGAGHPVAGAAVSWSTSDPAVATVDGTGLVRALADGTVTITATSDGQVAQVDLVVGHPVLALSQPQVGFAGPTGSGTQTQQLTVTNAGSGAVTGLSVRVAYGAGEPTGWLSASLSSTSAPASLTLRTDLRQLAPGIYHAFVTISSTARGAAPTTVAVQVTVGASVATFTFSSTTPTVTVNGQQTLTATPRDSTGAALPYPVTWTSLDPTIVLVSPTGVLTGVAPGTGHVVASAGGKADTIAVTVTQGTGVGGGGSGTGSLTLVVRVVNDDGGANAVGDLGVTTTAGALTFGAGAADGGGTLRYTSNTLTVNSGMYSLHESTLAGYAEGAWACSKGLVTGNPQNGSVSLAAGDAVTCTITNDDVPVAGITLSITTPTVTVSGKDTLTATVRDSTGAVLPYPVTWTSLDTCIVRVSPTGVLTGVAPGTGKVVATVGSVADTIVVTVVKKRGDDDGHDDGSGSGTGTGTGSGGSGSGSGTGTGSGGTGSGSGTGSGTGSGSSGSGSSSDSGSGGKSGGDGDHKSGDDDHKSGGDGDHKSGGDSGHKSGGDSDHKSGGDRSHRKSGDDDRSRGKSGGDSDHKS